MVTVYALFTAFYALMSLAFFFGESRSEWVFPLLILLVALLTVWTAIALWTGKDALVLTGISLAVVTALIGWIALPPRTWEASFILIVVIGVLGAALLVSLLSSRVRSALR